MGNKLQYLQVFTTVAKKTDAIKIAKALLNKKLSACTQIIGPVVSFYKWEGKTKKSREWLCLIKTRKDLYRSLEKTMKSIHPYKLPEIVAVPIIAGSREYFAWMDKEI